MAAGGVPNFDGLKQFESTIDSMFVRAVARWPDRPFVIAEGRSISYREMDRLVDRAARGLLGLGVQPGDRVALWMSNIWEWVVMQFAITRMGAVMTPINTRLRIEDLRHTLSDSGARVLITQARAEEFSYLDTIRAILRDRKSVPALEHVVVARPGGPVEAPFMAWQAFEDNASRQKPQPERDPRKMAYILYTSGTTSLPKGVMLSHANLNNCFNLAGDLDEGDIAFNAYPMFAITGCHNTVLALVLKGGGVVLQERFDAREAIELIEKHRCTVIGGIVYVLGDIVNEPGFAEQRVSSLRLAMIFPRRPEHLPVLHRLGLKTAGTGYGMTETGAHATYVSSLDPAEMTNDGRHWPVNEVKIVRADGSEAAPDEEGDIRVRGPQVMIGYFNRPAATAQALDPEGWLHTGDVGRMDEEGRLIWIGRRSDVYKCSGFNVASLEVEAFLSRHPDIVEVAVLGVPDSGKGEIGAAFIVARDSVALDLPAVREFCAGQIASYKIPGHVFVWQQLPKTASGKVRKVELKAFFLQQQQ
ncbi:MAG: class I adenylate-forming enzyme family protein [Rhodospirillales bacterium]